MHARNTTAHASLGWRSRVAFGAAERALIRPLGITESNSSLASSLRAALYLVFSYANTKISPKTLLRRLRLLQ
jgi:hypothetical protein